MYRACTEGEYLRRWWGPRRLEVSECDIDLRVGGTWRIVHRAPDGTEFAFHGEFLELDPPYRRVWTFVYEGSPEHEAVETLVLEEAEGGTMVTSTTRHDSIEARDMAYRQRHGGGDRRLLRPARRVDGCAAGARAGLVTTTTTQENLDIYGSKDIPWSVPLEQLEAGLAERFWLATVRPDGRPHLAGVGTRWLDGTLYFVSGAATRKSRNLEGRAHCVMAAQLPELDLTIEGRALRVQDHVVVERLANCMPPPDGRPVPVVE